MPRPIVALALPADEARIVSDELAGAGFEPVTIAEASDLEALLGDGRRVDVAILDAETDLDASCELYSLLHADGRSVPALIVVDDRSLEKLLESGSVEDEYAARPYAPESIRWRVEAMCIRSATVIDDESGRAVLAADLGFEDLGLGRGFADLATVLVVFNPKGGVGKTTIAANLAAAIQARGDRRVLLVDADTVTGHILSSLGIDRAPTLADAWTDELDGGGSLPIAQIAAAHPSGLRVLALTNSPLHVEVLEPERVAGAIEGARRAFDVIVVDLHPSYSALNRAIFGVADRILMPVTPDVPALRAAIQLRDIAVDLGIRDRVAMIVNRANSGVTVEDVERTTGMTALALIRSGGLLFVHAANEGRTVVERYPKEKVTADFNALAERLLDPVKALEPASLGAKSGFRLFGRAPARA
ncbi:MAG TPA: AAA family ATPase [Candidatus Dormibacteraeota bacterium]|nr:AAA family ATPase [Candidatus Dormibacteraeota bacterium]